jgi:hypothetical protein
MPLHFRNASAASDLNLYTTACKLHYAVLKEVSDSTQNVVITYISCFNLPVSIYIKIQY